MNEQHRSRPVGQEDSEEEIESDDDIAAEDLDGDDSEVRHKFFGSM